MIDYIQGGMGESYKGIPGVWIHVLVLFPETEDKRRRESVDDGCVSGVGRG